MTNNLKNKTQFDAKTTDLNVFGGEMATVTRYLDIHGETNDFLSTKAVGCWGSGPYQKRRCKHSMAKGNFVPELLSPIFFRYNKKRERELCWLIFFMDASLILTVRVLRRLLRWNDIATIPGIKYMSATEDLVLLWG